MLLVHSESDDKAAQEMPPGAATASATAAASLAAPFATSQQSLSTAPGSAAAVSVARAAPTPVLAPAAPGVAAIPEIFTRGSPAPALPRLPAPSAAPHVSDPSLLPPWERFVTNPRTRPAATSAVVATPTDPRRRPMAADRSASAASGQLSHAVQQTSSSGQQGKRSRKFDQSAAAAKPVCKIARVDEGAASYFSADRENQSSFANK